MMKIFFLTLFLGMVLAPECLHMHGWTFYYAFAEIHLLNTLLKYLKEHLIFSIVDNVSPCQIDKACSSLGYEAETQFLLLSFLR